MSRGYMSRGYMSGGKCPGGTCPGGLCPRTVFHMEVSEIFKQCFSSFLTFTDVQMGRHSEAIKHP